MYYEDEGTYQCMIIKHWQKYFFFFCGIESTDRFRAVRVQSMKVALQRNLLSIVFKHHTFKKNVIHQTLTKEVYNNHA